MNIPKIVRAFAKRNQEKQLPTIQAEEDLFGEIQKVLPSEPLIKLRPPKENPGIKHGAELVRSLYHHREDHLGRNISPTNTFEIWFDEEQIHFYYHPDSMEMKNTGTRHFADKYPGVDPSERRNPFPKIEEGDFIAGTKLTLTEHYARPLRTLSGPKSFERDPFGSLTSEMVAEGERTSSGERVRAEDVRMVVQIAFKPVSRDWSRGGIFGTNLNSYADNLKSPVYENSIPRLLLGLGPKERQPTKKKRQAATVISKFKGEPGFEVDIRVICISPYEEIARQHSKGVIEVFQTYNNPVTEQALDPLKMDSGGLEVMLENMAARRMNTSMIGAMSGFRNLLTVPELAGFVHLPNKSVQTPAVDWTKRVPGAGVPSSTPGLREISTELEEAAEQEQAAASGVNADQAPYQPGQQTGAQTSTDATTGEADLPSVSEQVEGDSEIDLEFGSEEVLEGDQGRIQPEMPTDGRGLAVDEAATPETDDESDPDDGGMGILFGGDDHGDESEDKVEADADDSPDDPLVDMAGETIDDDDDEDSERSPTDETYSAESDREN